MERVARNEWRVEWWCVEWWRGTGGVRNGSATFSRSTGQREEAHFGEAACDGRACNGRHVNVWHVTGGHAGGHATEGMQRLACNGHLRDEEEHLGEVDREGVVLALIDDESADLPRPHVARIFWPREVALEVRRYPEGRVRR